MGIDNVVNNIRRWKNNLPPKETRVQRVLNAKKKVWYLMSNGINFITLDDWTELSLKEPSNFSNKEFLEAVENEKI